MQSDEKTSGRPLSLAATRQIHSAFWRMLDATEFHLITMERLAEAAAVSRPALYRRYRNVAEVTLAALLAFGEQAIIMEQRSDLAQDLERYFTQVVNSLKRTSPVGKALRIILARAQTDELVARSFRNFLTLRREPVRSRVKREFNNLSSLQLELVLDQLFGPILYRLLIRNMDVNKTALRAYIAAGLGFVSSLHDKPPVTREEAVQTRRKGN